MKRILIILLVVIVIGSITYFIVDKVNKKKAEDDKTEDGNDLPRVLPDGYGVEVVDGEAKQISFEASELS